MPSVQRTHDCSYADALDEPGVDFSHNADFFGWPQNEPDLVGLEVLFLTYSKQTLRVAISIQQAPAEAVTRSASELASGQSQSPLCGEDLCGKLPAVLARHHSLERLQERRDGGIVVGKWLSTVMDSNPRLLAEKLVVGAFIGVLEASPAAHVIHQNDFVASSRAQDVLQ